MKRATVACVICILLLSGCQSQPKARPTKPPIELREILPPPKAADGMVVALPSNPSKDEEWCMDILGVPKDGIVFSEPKALQAGRLRIYSEEVYIASQFNKNYCEMWSDAAIQELNAAQERERKRLDEDTSWWSTNKSTMVFMIGVAVGATTTILIVYGLNQAGGASR